MPVTQEARYEGWIDRSLVLNEAHSFGISRVLYEPEPRRLLGLQHRFKINVADSKLGSLNPCFALALWRQLQETSGLCVRVLRTFRHMESLRRDNFGNNSGRDFSASRDDESVLLAY